MEPDSPWGDALDRAVSRHTETLVAVRRHLHRYPEPSGEERETTQYLEDLLQDAGLTPSRGPEDLGLIADFGDPAAGPPVALRADIDALRIRDVKPVPYRSHVDGVMHACGHDGHTAAMLGAVLGLIDAKRESNLPWPIRWRALFQSSEETNHGALALIESGALDGVAAIFGLHADPGRRVGSVGVQAGAITADCRFVEIEVLGKGGHAARPHETIDPLAAAVRLINTIYADLSRTLGAHDPVVFTIGQVEGATSPNVIPDRVVLRGTLRTLDAKVGEAAWTRIVRLAQGEQASSGAEVNASVDVGPPSVRNDTTVTDVVRRSAVHVVGVEGVEPIPRPSMGGEDFANYQVETPGCLFRLGCAITPGSSPPLHAPDFDLDEASITIGARILARSVVNWYDPDRTAGPGL